MEDTDSHYTRKELWDAVLGLVPPAHAAAIRQHFESGCVACQNVACAMVEELLGEPPELPEAAEAALAPGGVAGPDPYDLAIDRALGRALEKVGQIRREQARIPEALSFLTERGAQDFGREAPARLRSLAGVDALLQKSWEIRYDDPHEMVFRAALAVGWAHKLDAKRFGAAFVRDVQGRALVELGNAHRVADELEMAQKTLDEAARALEEGTGDELLEARFCDAQASLHADRRFFSASCDALDMVHAIHQRHGDRHLAGRALISKSLYALYQGKTADAEGLILRGLELIDRDREPFVFQCAVHNLLVLLTEQGRFREARNALFLHRPGYMAAAGKIQLLKIRALEGRIASGLGKLDQAEGIFREVWQGFERERLGYKAALASLELAVVLRQAGRDAESLEVVLEASEAFLSLGVHREALAAMLVLRKACEEGLATPALLQSTIQFLLRAENNPELSAEDFLVP